MNTITIPPEYVHRLARVQGERLKHFGHDTSLPGLVESIISDWLYAAESQFELSPRMLPVEEIHGKRYYRDERLKEYRNVENPHDRITLNALDTMQMAAHSSPQRRMTPQTITREEWMEIFQLPQIREAWGFDDQSTPEEFASVCYGARFDFVSGGPGYCGDLYVLYGDALSGVPIILIRDSEHRLMILESDEQ
jgi:hypothetical protein